MKRLFLLVLTAAVSAWGLAGPAPAQEPVQGTAAAAEARRAEGNAAGDVQPQGGGADRPEVYEVDLGKVWNVHPAYFRKVFDGAGETEPAGLKAKIEQNLYGKIQTKWGPADLLFGNMAIFFGGSPVLLDREFAVRRSMLYD